MLKIVQTKYFMIRYALLKFHATLCTYIATRETHLLSVYGYLCCYRGHTLCNNDIKFLLSVMYMVTASPKICSI